MRRVLIVQSGSVLDEGVENLLMREADLEVSGRNYADEAAFVQDVVRTQPDAVVLNEAGPLNLARIMELLNDCPTLETVRVVIVRLDDNTIDVFERQRVIATQVGDLVRLIRRDGSRS